MGRKGQVRNRIEYHFEDEQDRGRDTSESGGSIEEYMISVKIKYDLEKVIKTIKCTKEELELSVDIAFFQEKMEKLDVIEPQTLEYRLPEESDRLGALLAVCKRLSLSPWFGECLVDWWMTYDEPGEDKEVFSLKSKFPTTRM